MLCFFALSLLSRLTGTRCRFGDLLFGSGDFSFAGGGRDGPSLLWRGTWSRIDSGWLVAPL